MAGSGGPARVEVVDGVEERPAEGDGVDGAAVAPVRLRHLDVAGAAGDGQPAPEDAAAERRDVEIGRFRDDGAVGAVAAVDDGQRAHAARFLVDDRGEEDVAAQADAGGAQDFQGGDRRGHPRFHVGGAAPVDRSRRRRSAAKGSTVQPSPALTTSAWPRSMSDGPPPLPGSVATRLGRPRKSRSG